MRSMTIENGYRDDLACIHDIGYGDIARGAATRLIKELSALGCGGRRGNRRPHPAYGSASLPPGVVAFLARKSAAGAV